VPIVGTSAAIFDAQGRILCVRQNTGIRKWTLPGGHVQRGESPIEAVIREVREETGYRVTVGELIGVYATPASNRLILHFHAAVVGRGRWRPTREIGDLGFFGRDDLPLPMYARTITRIVDAFEGQIGVMRVCEREAEQKAS
jgi:ADP-ribose pyrophosphatase YjhB (NUDIX family)